MLVLPFYDFWGFRSVAVNSVYKLQFFYIFDGIESGESATYFGKHFNFKFSSSLVIIVIMYELQSGYIYKSEFPGE